MRIVAHPPGPLPAIPQRRASWRAELDGAVVDSPIATETRRRLARTGTLVVTTGQQPGLFTGPIYTIHKALAAAALARTLAGQWQCDVVPLFWIAGDDHDYAEASVASWLDDHGGIVEWRLPPRPEAAPQLPLSAEPVPAVIADGLALLERTLPVGVQRDRTMDWLRRHYQPGVSLHAACRGAVAELLAPFGVACIDPTVEAFKRAQAPLIRQALDAAPEIDATLADLADPETGITAGDDATLVFVVTDSGRERLMRTGDGFRTRRSGRHYTRTELLQLLDDAPDRFSANVLLRPVVESALLPTVAYVAGPGELRYLRDQASVVYAILDVPVQVPVPRWSGTVVPRWAERLLTRLHVSADAVVADDGALGREILARDFPADARQALDALNGQIDRSAGVVTAAAARIDPVLDRAMRGRIGRMREIAADIERVVERHLRKRDDVAFAQYSRLSDVLRPHGAPQERVLTAATWLARYGDQWLDAVVQQADAWAAPPTPDTAS